MSGGETWEESKVRQKYLEKFVPDENGYLYTYCINILKIGKRI